MSESGVVRTCVFCEMVEKGKVDMGVVLGHFVKSGKVSCCKIHKEAMAEGVSKLLQTLSEKLVDKVTSL